MPFKRTSIVVHSLASLGAPLNAGPDAIGDVGIREAIERLLPSVITAGRIVRALQPAVAAQEDRKEKGGSRFSSALTDVDLIIEDRLGADVLMLFSDASFAGEEAKSDHISRYVPAGRKYLITLDPVNGTLYYRDGLPIYEVIVTICEGNTGNIRGVMIYAPAREEAFLAYYQHRDIPVAWRLKFSDEARLRYEEQLLICQSSDHVKGDIYLASQYERHEEELTRLGYRVLFPQRDYDGRKDWSFHTANLLTGECVGTFRHDAPLIDHIAFGFVLECAGGCVSRGKYDPATMTFAHHVVATDKDTFDILMSLLAK